MLRRPLLSRTSSVAVATFLVSASSPRQQQQRAPFGSHSFPASHNPAFAKQRLVKSPDERSPLTMHRPKLERESLFGDQDLPKSSIGLAVELLLYDTALNDGNLIEPPWVPLPVIMRRLPEAVLAELDNRPELTHGLRSVLEMELPRSCNLRFDAVTKAWVAQKRPMSDTILVLADAFNKCVLSQSEHVVNVTFMALRISPEMKRMADDRYGSVAKAVQRAVEQVPGLAFTLKRHSRLAVMELVVKPAYHHMLPKRGRHGRLMDEWSEAVTATQPASAAASSRRRPADDEDEDDDGPWSSAAAATENKPKAFTSPFNSSFGGGSTSAADIRMKSAVNDRNLDPRLRQATQARLLEEREKTGVAPTGAPMVESKGEAVNLPEKSDHMLDHLHDLLRAIRQQKQESLAAAEACGEASTETKTTTSASSPLQPKSTTRGELEIDDAPALRDDQRPERFRVIASEPTSSSLSASANYRATSSGTFHHSQAHIDVRRLIPHIPTFFVPLELVAESKELVEAGYTAQHIEEYFASTRNARTGVNVSGLEIVTLPSTVDLGEGAPARLRKFIRLHGHEGGYEMTESLAADSKFFRFYCRPFHAVPFLKVMRNPNRWIRIESLLQLINQSDLSALAFQREETILFFAQLQQWFSFSPREGGMVARKPQPGEPEYEQQPPPSLDCTTTPLPLVYNEVLRVARAHHTVVVPVTELEQLVPRSVLQNLWQNFGRGGPRKPDHLFVPPLADAETWANWAAAHYKEFVFDAKLGGIALKQRVHLEEVKGSGDLEDEIAYALEHHRDRPKQIQALRRRLAIQRNPDHPFLVGEVLAKAIHDEVLPEDRHVAIKNLIPAMTNDMRDFLPKTGLYKFLLRYHGEIVNVFELRGFDGRLFSYVSRVNVKPPPGAVTDTQVFTKKDVVRLVIEILQGASQNIGAEDRAVGDIIHLLPTAVRTTGLVNKAWHVVEMLEKLPQVFVLTRAVDNIRVRLIRVPTEEELDVMDRIE